MPDFESHQRQPGSEDITRSRLSRRRAIRKRCLDCSAGSRKEVEQCNKTKCALLPFRMGEGKQDPAERKRAIRAYCLWCCAGQPKEVRLCPSNECTLYPFRMGKQSLQDAFPMQENAIYGSDSDGGHYDEGDSSSEEADDD